MIEQHKLRRSQIRLTLHRKLIAPMSDPGTLELLHGSAVEEGTFVA